MATDCQRLNGLAHQVHLSMLVLSLSHSLIDSTIDWKSDQTLINRNTSKQYIVFTNIAQNNLLGE